MELLQFAYFNRNDKGVIGIDILPEMLEASRKNFIEAEKENSWFKSSFVDLRQGNALNLPVEDNSIDVAAQNCVFNIFKTEDWGFDFKVHGSPFKLELLQQPHHVLLNGICLGKGIRARLHQNVLLGEVGRLLAEIHIPDTGLGGFDVDLSRRDVVDGYNQLVLHRPDISPDPIQQLQPGFCNIHDHHGTGPGGDPRAVILSGISGKNGIGKSPGRSRFIGVKLAGNGPVWAPAELITLVRGPVAL